VVFAAERHAIEHQVNCLLLLLLLLLLSSQVLHARGARSRAPRHRPSSKLPPSAAAAAVIIGAPIACLPKPSAAPSIVK
jgi:hypothetical protein